MAVRTIVGAALQEETALLQDPEVSDADEVVVHARNLPVARKPGGAWKAIRTESNQRNRRDAGKQMVRG